jgi:hypothetical protein
LQGLVTAKYNTKGVEEAIATEVNLIDEPFKHKVPEVNLEETINDEDENMFENAENAKKDYQVTCLLDVAPLNIDEQAREGMPPNILKCHTLN